MMLATVVQAASSAASSVSSRGDSPTDSSFSAADRSAAFVCVLALARPGLPTLTTEGRVTGVIAAAPVGEGGFGYDPVFFVPDYGKTMAQLPPSLKNAISHRALAARAMRVEIERILAEPPRV